MRRLRLLPLLLFLSACGPCASKPDPGVKIVVPAMPTTLDWNTSDPTSWTNYPVMLATMRGLTSLGPDNEVRPGLAASWEQARTREGQEVYTFHLREDVRWSDGVPLVAQDFVVGWRRALVGKERGELADVVGAEAVLAAIEKGASTQERDALMERFEVRALDAHTLRIVLTHPRSYFLSRMANVYLFFPAPSAQLEGKSEEEIRAYFDRPKDGHPVSLGPWRLEDWDRAGERVRLVRNPSSAFAPEAEEGFAQPERVTLLRSEIGPALFERGRVGFVFVDSAIALRQNRTPDLQRRELLSTYFLAFNTQKPPLDRPEVRRAIAQALDREALLKDLLPAARPSRTLLPKNLPGAMRAEDEARLVPYAPETAREVLRQVDRPLRLVFNAGETFIPGEAITERIRAQLAKVGVKIELDARRDYAAEIARKGPDGIRTYDLYLRRIGADYAHPKTFFTLFERNGNHQTGWETCDGGTSIRRFEALLAEGDAAADEETARRAYTAAQLLLLREEAVIVPIYHPDRYFRIAPGLRGVEIDPFNFISLSELVTRAGAAPK